MTVSQNRRIDAAETLRREWLAAATFSMGSYVPGDGDVVALLECPVGYVNQLKRYPKGQAMVALRVANRFDPAMHAAPNVSVHEAEIAMRLAGAMQQMESLRQTIRADQLRPVSDWLGADLLQRIVLQEPTEDEAASGPVGAFDLAKAKEDGARILSARLANCPAALCRDLAHLTDDLAPSDSLPASHFDEALAIVRAV
ncbi:hypothetical protein N9H60_02340 [Flavimaricola sp.]|nr:hypothetical protein [Flavimaricola sp.]MDA9019998.1 hypothetical protein [Flavimaricola sp.]